MNLKEIIGMNLKYYRYKAGESQEKFYTKRELSYKYFAGAERGEANLTIENIENVANKICVDFEKLIIYDDIHNIKKKKLDEKEKIGA